MLAAKVSRLILSLLCYKDLDTQLGLGKLTNRRILLVLAVLACYYGTEVEMLVLVALLYHEYFV